MDQPIEIFRTGRHTAMSGLTLQFSEADLAASAAAYDPALHEAPIVVGHPATDAPAYGWISGLAVAGDRLQAQPSGVDAAFAELVRQQRFKHVSASFYTPTAPGNPKPGVYYLRHVGFLGAQPPAVKGLKPVNFAAGTDGVVEFSDAWTIGTIARLLRGLREWIIGREGQDAADRALPTWDLDALTEQAAMERSEAIAAPAYAEPTPQQEPQVPDTTAPAPDPGAARIAELQAEVDRLRIQSAAFAEREAEARRADDAAFLERLTTEGRLLPATRPLAAGLLAALDGGEALAFAEGRQAETPRLALRALLAAAPVAVHFGEIAPPGAVLTRDDPQAIALAAQQLQDKERAAGRDISFAEAVDRVAQTTGA